jgi:PhnB protein
MYDPRRGYPSVVPYVRYRDPAAAIAWFSAVLGGHEAIRMTLPDGGIGHAELVVDSHVIAVGLAPTGNGGTPPGDRSSVRAMTLVFVADVDAATNTAVELGGTVVHPPTDMLWGLRQSIAADPEGHVWELSNHHHDVPLSDWGAKQTGSWVERPAEP